MNDMRKHIRRVFWMIFALFFFLSAYLTKYILFDSKDIVSSVYNPRINVMDEKVHRGDILDRNGEVLARTEQGQDGYIRTYPYQNMFAHVVGFVGPEKYGVEKTSNFQLQKLHWETYQRIRQIITDDALLGQNVATTLDQQIQQQAYELLGSRKGGIVVMEPSTGKIIAMVSYPAFDPNTITANIGTLQQDVDNSPLINRASQGLYPPGSVFKMVTAAAAIENGFDVENYTFECTGSATFGDQTIRCYDGKAHGVVDMKKAMAVSCNGYFASVGVELGGATLRSAADSFYFNQGINYELEYNFASFPMNGSAELSEIVETSFGQGRTLTSPLHMALVTSAIANGGVMMRPYVVDYAVKPSGGKGAQKVPEKLDNIMLPTTAYRITEYMEEVVSIGTAQNAAIQGVRVAGKTGTAQNASGADHAWFVGFAPAEKPKVVVSVVLENVGSGSNAVPIGQKLMKSVLDKIE